MVLTGPLVPKDLGGDNNPLLVVWLGCTIAANRISVLSVLLGAESANPSYLKGSELLQPGAGLIWNDV